MKGSRYNLCPIQIVPDTVCSRYNLFPIQFVPDCSRYNMFPIQFVPDTICSRYNLCRYNLYMNRKKRWLPSWKSSGNCQLVLSSKRLLAKLPLPACWIFLSFIIRHIASQRKNCRAIVLTERLQLRVKKTGHVCCAHCICSWYLKCWVCTDRCFDPSCLLWSGVP